MKFWPARWSRRSASPLENPAIPLAQAIELMDFGGGRFAGVSVTPASMMTLPAVAACVRLIGDTMATMSLNVVDAADNPAPALPLWRIMHDAVNPETTSVAWRRSMFRDVLVDHGDHFSRLEWDRANRLRAIWRLDPSRMTVAVRDGRRIYTYRLLTGGTETYPAEDILHIQFDPAADGLRSRRPVDVLREAVGLGLAQQRYGARFFENGGHPSVIVSQPGATSAEAKDRAARSIAQRLAVAVGKSSGVLVLDGGQKADVVSTDPRSGQFLESRAQQFEEICGVYGVPPALVSHYGGGLPRSIDFLTMLFIKTCVRPWAEIVEAELALKIATGDKRIVFDLTDLERGDFKARVEAVSRGVQSGVFTPNDGRRLFRLPRSAQTGADDLYLQQNMANVSALPGADAADGAAELDGDEP